MLKKLFTLTVIILSTNISALEVERPYMTDGCTGWFDGTRKYDWSHCCQKHDLKFWAGGTKSSRKQADKELKKCIKNASNNFHATIIRAGVFLGSLSPVKIESKKWGNAWGQNAGKFELTQDNIDQLEDSLYKEQNVYSNEEIRAFINKLRANSHDRNNQ